MENPSMANDLAFINILAAAMRHPDDGVRWHQAFERIERLIGKPNSAAGPYWRRFVETALASAASGEAQAVAETAFRTLLDRIGYEVSVPESRPALTRTSYVGPEPCAPLRCAIRDSMARTSPGTLQVHLDGELMASWALPLTSEAIASGLHPGWLTIGLDTGWRLWSGRLAEEDLLWKWAFPERRLPMAAQSGPTHVHYSRRINLPVAMLTMVVYPGVETGSIGIVTDPKPG
jgi:hypothetical protein